MKKQIMHLAAQKQINRPQEDFFVLVQEAAKELYPEFNWGLWETDELFNG